jgi:mannonate dehydratase
MIELADKAGISGLNYNLTILPVLRTGTTPGRGGSQYSTWKYTEAPKGPLTSAGIVPLEVSWERITYFLERVIPVATEHKVRMACHIADPGTVPGYRGIDRALGTVDGLKRFIEITQSPYHGFNFCIGSTAEGLQNPGREIYDVVRYFGERKKLFNIHFRNIKGKRDDFQEVYPDEGDLDMYRIIKILKEVEYPYMLMPDHMPYHPDDPGGRQAFAFGFGYIKGMIQAVVADAGTLQG